MKASIVMHAGMAGLALAACILAPRSGQAVLLLPIGSHGGTAAGIVAGGTELVGGGRLPGSWVVYPANGVSAWSFVEQGFLPIAAPAALCGQGT